MSDERRIAGGGAALDRSITTLDVECPLCWARPGEDCSRAHPFTTPHAIRAAMAERAEIRRVRVLRECAAV